VAYPYNQPRGNQQNEAKANFEVNQGLDKRCLILPLEQVDLIMANPPYLAATFFEKVAAAGLVKKPVRLEMA
jgi:hypothetical protein